MKRMFLFTKVSNEKKQKYRNEFLRKKGEKVNSGSNSNSNMVWANKNKKPMVGTFRELTNKERSVLFPFKTKKPSPKKKSPSPKKKSPSPVHLKKTTDKSKEKINRSYLKLRDKPKAKYVKGHKVGTKKTNRNKVSQIKASIPNDTNVKKRLQKVMKKLKSKRK